MIWRNFIQKAWTHHHHRFKVRFPCLLGLDGPMNVSPPLGTCVPDLKRCNGIFAFMIFEARFYDRMPLLTSTSLIMEGSPLVAFYDILRKQWENSRSYPPHRATSLKYGNI